MALVRWPRHLTMPTDTLDLDNWFTPAALADPYPIYRRLRETDPVHFNPILGSWVLTRHADVAAALQDPRLSSRHRPDRFVRAPLPEELPALAVLEPYLVHFMQGMDPPAHTRQRALVGKAFTPRTVERLRPWLERWVEGALDRAESVGEFDFVATIASPLPAASITTLLGVPPEGAAHVITASAVIAEYLPIFAPEPGQFARLAERLRGVEEYMTGLVAERRASPQEDLLSAMLEAEEGGELLSERELTVLPIMLLSTGHEATTNLLCNCVHALLEHPDQWDRLRAEPAPELVAGAVEEALRFEAPVQFIPREAQAELELGDRTIAAGQRLLLMFAAANRDPAQHPDPDRFDIARQGRHLAFGHGLHYCIAAALARMHAQVVVAALARRFPRLRVAAGGVQRRPNVVYRGFSSLRLQTGP